MTDSYEYPPVLYCVECDADVEPRLEEKAEALIVDGHETQEGYKVACCPLCGRVLCERDRDYTIIRAARRETDQ